MLERGYYSVPLDSSTVEQMQQRVCELKFANISPSCNVCLTIFMSIVYIVYASYRTFTWESTSGGAAGFASLTAIHCDGWRPGSMCLFVCCHGARDTRCGAHGPPLAAALTREVRLTPFPFLYSSFALFTGCAGCSGGIFLFSLGLLQSDDPLH
jgi:hypothetical protein